MWKPPLCQVTASKYSLDTWIRADRLSVVLFPAPHGVRAILAGDPLFVNFWIDFPKHFSENQMLRSRHWLKWRLLFCFIPAGIIRCAQVFESRVKASCSAYSEKISKWPSAGLLGWQGGFIYANEAIWKIPRKIIRIFCKKVFAHYIGISYNFINKMVF